MRQNRLRGAIAVVVGLLAITAVIASTAGAASGYVCSGGPIAAGSYRSVTVTGVCFTEGTVDVSGGLTIASGAGLDAMGGTCDTFLNVSGGIDVMAGGVLFLGNSQGTGCDGNSNDVVRGGLRASSPLAVVVHGTRIDGGFVVAGGGGGTGCGPATVGGIELPFPPYTDVEDTAINGGASISGMSTCWMGFIRNQVAGGVQINDNTLGDPDAIEVGLNTISGNLACAGNALDPALGGIPGGVPTNSFDGSPPNPNTVSGRETGQCAGL